MCSSPFELTVSDLTPARAQLLIHSLSEEACAQGAQGAQGGARDAERSSASWPSVLAEVQAIWDRAINLGTTQATDTGRSGPWTIRMQPQPLTAGSDAEHEFLLELQNRGTPLFIDHWITERGMHVQTQNRGRDGQAFLWKWRAPRQSMTSRDSGAAPSVSGSSIIPSGPSLPAAGKRNDCPVGWKFRKLEPQDFEEVSALFHRVYGYNYINENAYHPERLRQLSAEGKIISYVAEGNEDTQGAIAAHLALLQLNDEPRVYDMGMGLSDPRIKSRGLFSALLQKLMDVAETIPMEYLVFDYVTNHDHSQRIVGRYGAHELALNIGCQLSETQARLTQLGLGEDPGEMDRYSILLGIKAQVEQPFGSRVSLPIALGEPLGFLLEPFGVEWVPTSRFSVLDPSGSFHMGRDPFQQTLSIDLTRPGYRAVERIVHEWRSARRQGYQYCSVDIPTEAEGLGQAYDLFSAKGFFVAGFVPFRSGNKLALRMQATGPRRVAFDELKVASAHGKRLLHVVRDSYERNHPL